MKKNSFTRLSLRKIRRTIFRSPLQFLAMVLILALGSTLFSGLYASHLAFSKQVDQVYEWTNTYDVWTNTYYNIDNDPYTRSQENFIIIQDTVNDNGEVEGQFNASARINGIEDFISLSDQYPTIDKPYKTYDKGTTNDYFFLFNRGFIYNASAYGERSNWIDEDGNFVDVKVEIDINNLKNRLTDNGLLTILDEFKTNASAKNIFSGTHLLIKGTPTGYMLHPENILPNTTRPSTFIMSRNYLSQHLVKTINENFKIEKLKQEWEKATDPTRKAKLGECYELLTNSKEKIMDCYWCNNLYLTRLNNRQDAAFYRNKIEDAFKNKPDNNIMLNYDLANSNTHKQLNTDILQSLQLCYVFPPVFFLVAVLVVLTTLSQIILKERGDIGALKAIGASNRSIFIYYLTLTGLVSLIGIAIGLIVGPLLLPGILDLKYDMLYTLPALQYVFPTVVAIVMTLVVLGITLLVSYLIARKEVKSLPVVSMRPKVVKIKRTAKLSSGTTNTHKLCFRMAMRNIFCSPVRSIMVIIGVLGCAGLLTCGFGVDDSINAGINHDLTSFFNTSVMVYLNNPTDETSDEIQRMVDEGKITTYEAYGYLPSVCYRAGNTTTTFAANVYSLDTAHEPTNKFFDMGYLPKNNNIAITNKVAKNLDIKVGDSLNFTFLGKTYSGRVGKIIDCFYIHGVFVDGLSSNFPMVTQYPTCAFARFGSGFNEKDLIQEISEIPGIGSILDNNDLKTSIEEISSSISYITITIKIFAILLALVVLYNLALLNFNENIRNIATMKVLGFNRREVAESLFFEIMVLSVIGTLFGLAIGYPLARLTLGINQVPMCEFFYYLSAASVFISLAITLGVSAVVNTYLGLKNRKVKMVESLKTVE